MKKQVKPYIVYRISDTKPNPDKFIHKLFSGVKLGHKNSLKMFAEVLIDKIKNKIDLSKKEKWVITNSPSTLTKCTPMYYVAAYISKQLKIPHVRIIHRAMSNEHNYYLDLSPAERRKYHSGTLYYRGRSLKNKNIIIIEDVYSSGAVLKAATKLLFNHGAANIHPFVFMKVKSIPATIERDLSIANISKDKNYVPKILNDGEAVITTRMISSILLSEPKEAKRIIGLFKPNVKKEFLKILSEYIKKDALMRERYKTIML